MKAAPAVIATLAALSLSAFGQKMQTPTGEAPGPWILGTIGIGKQPDGTMKTTALKGLAIKVGEHGEAAVAYDLDLCRMAGAWSGKFTTPMNLMSRGEFPTALGEIAFTTGEVPGFEVKTALSSIEKDQSDPRKGRSDAANRRSDAANLRSDAANPRSDAANLRSDAANPRSDAANPRPDAANPRPDAANLRPDAANLRSDAANLRSDAANLRPDAANPRSDAANLRSDAAKDRSVSGTLWHDPRPEPFGPLPPGQARFRGFYVNGDKTILKWDLAGVEVLEMPGYKTFDDYDRFVRSFEVAPTDKAISIPIFSNPPSDAKASSGTDDLSPWVQTAFASFSSSTSSVATVAWGDSTCPLGFERRSDGIFLTAGPNGKVARFSVAVWRTVTEFTGTVAGKWFAKQFESTSLSALIAGGPARWPEPVVTTGELSKDTASAYVVDTIKLPDPNPWGAPMFVGGFDFFPDGRAAVCTFHGDVFFVSGLDDKLEHVTWKRFASGLYHPLGLKIVNGEIYVTCRDGIWRLKDLNGDGEADFYEAFNFDVKVTKSFHEFVFDLQTDPAGNFYFAKAGPVKNGGRGFDPIMAHHGSLFRVSPDGKKFDVIATGFRAPNGLGVGPHGELTSGDNEGTWTPVCKINWIKPGGFYGVVPLSHHDPLPTSYDPPLCWLPKRVDNSSGSQVWVPEGGRWGPWSGKMLHLSYGQAALYGVLFEKDKDDVIQGGVTRFPLQFQSGIMRARFSPKDGQLYVAGLRGWQTNGLKNGCFQRVRYTGAETRMPIELHVKKDGIELRFTASLDTQSARDPENWHLEQWRYLWSAAYGSPELSTETDPEAPAEAGNDGAAQFTKAQMSVAKHDPVTVKSVTIGTDDRTVFLEIPDLKPVMQMSIKYDLKTAEGKELRGEVVNTINALGSE